MVLFTTLQGINMSNLTTYINRGIRRVTRMGCYFNFSEKQKKAGSRIAID
jgi:hypothetical protein